MDLVTDAAELVRRIRQTSFVGDIPEALRTRLQGLSSVPADTLVDGAEVLYAHYDQLDDPTRELVGQLYNYAVQMSWTAFNRDGRSAAIVALVRRDLGEKGTGVAAKSAEYPEPEKNRREGVDWREPAEQPPAPDAE